MVKKSKKAKKVKLSEFEQGRLAVTLDLLNSAVEELDTVGDKFPGTSPLSKEARDLVKLLRRIDSRVEWTI